MHSSGRELGLLELQRLLIREPPALAHAEMIYAIFDPQTNLKVGVARGVSGSGWKFLHSFLNRTWLPIKLEVCETEDESLVFTVHWMANWWRRRLEVYDAEDSLIGYGDQRTFSGRRSFWLYDRRGLPFVEVQEARRDQHCFFLGAGGREMGAVTRSFTDTGERPPRATNHYAVSIAEDLTDQPFAKMLLLGAAFAIHIIPHTKAK